ncbi:ESPR-type extended signal peptide-containing protein, partial [Rodentibacter ratti]|uniref:ESPR-type extended signal peptide-containing protein n=1 Tax=Rodentibacter ratti TaxID=1906745 RepID=UPI002118E9D8
MNKVFKIIFNKKLGDFVVVSELAASNGKSTSQADERISVGTKLATISALGLLALSSPTYAVQASSGAIDGTSGLAIHYGEANGNAQTIAIGGDQNHYANATGHGAIAIGASSQTNGEAAVAIGCNTSALDKYATAIGSDTTAQSSGSITIGHKVIANKVVDITKSYDFGLGNGAKNITPHAIGTNDQNNVYSYDINGAASAAANNSVLRSGNLFAVGSAKANGYLDMLELTAEKDTLATTTDSGGKNAIAIGNTVLAQGNNTVALGRAAFAIGERAISQGSYSYARGSNAIALGTAAKALANNTIAIGVGTGINSASDGSTVIGHSSISNSVDTTVLGSRNKVWGNANQSVVIGAKNDVDNANSTIIGQNIVTSGSNISDIVAIGNSAKVSQAGGVAIGSFSNATRLANTLGYDAVTNSTSNNTSATWNATNAAVAVGDGTTVTRQITGVAAGSEDTDVVNVAQLKGIHSYVSSVADIVNSNLTKISEEANKAASSASAA